MRHKAQLAGGKFLEVVRKVDPESEETINVLLRCLLCHTDFISSAAKVANKQKVCWEEKELELMCTAVDEFQFGNALLDCILVPESKLSVSAVHSSWHPSC